MTVLVIFFVLLLLGMPIGFVLGITGIAGIIDAGGGATFLSMAPKRFFAGLNLFPFLAMPFFILAGEIMNHTGITQRLVLFAEALVGYLRGGLAHSNMVASVFFAGITGAATADAAAFGKTLVPAMVKQGYDRPFACAVTAAGSIIGPTIPPSSLMVIYGSIMGVSIGGLFAAGILPGLLICVVCMAIIAGLAKRRNLPKADKAPSLMEILKAFRSSLIALIMPVIILGGILFGVVTPTEAASVAVAYALFVGVVIYRAITIEDFIQMLIRTARVTGVIFLIIASASMLGWWLAFEQIPQAIAAGFLGISEDPNVVIALLLILLLLVGLLMDITAILIILAPVLAPLTLAIGMDPVHAWIVFVLALNISLMTPPVGACLFVLSSVTGERIERIAAALWPFLLAEVAILVLIAYWPDFALFLPRTFGF
ncbi:MAG: TRAP transporter large permease [Geminicoccaceae bacterium]